MPPSLAAYAPRRVGAATAKDVRAALRSQFPPFAGFREVESSSYYGKGYQDVEHRKPAIRNARRLLGWTPTVTMDVTIDNTLDFFLRTVEPQADK